MLVLISVSADWTGELLNYMGQIFTDLNLLILLVVGLPLGFWVIRKVIGLVVDMTEEDENEDEDEIVFFEEERKRRLRA